MVGRKPQVSKVMVMQIATQTGVFCAVHYLGWLPGVMWEGGVWFVRGI